MVRLSAARKLQTHFSDNFMSMILDDFNYNQLRMSSSIGLSAPMVARHSLKADGANSGLNGANRLHDASPSWGI